MSENTNEAFKNDLTLRVSILKEAYVKIFENKEVMKDLSEFCKIEPLDCRDNGNSIDNSKLAISAGRAMVLQRIEYYATTPTQEIVNNYINMLGVK